MVQNLFSKTAASLQPRFSKDVASPKCSYKVGHLDLSQRVASVLVSDPTTQKSDQQQQLAQA